MALPWTEIFVVFIMIVLIFVYLSKQYGEVKYVRSSLDNREYLVQNFENKTDAANLLAEVAQNLQQLVNHMISKYPTNEECIRLYNNFNPDNISEGSASSGYTSYTVNKGQKLVICIRNTDGSFVDLNTLLFVSIHELGHVGTSSIGHEPEFWSCFRFLIDEAILIGLYKEEDYAKQPKNYCGIKINSSILY